MKNKKITYLIKKNTSHQVGCGLETKKRTRTRTTPQDWTLGRANDWGWPYRRVLFASEVILTLRKSIKVVGGAVGWSGAAEGGACWGEPPPLSPPPTRKDGGFLPSNQSRFLEVYQGWNASAQPLQTSFGLFYPAPSPSGPRGDGYGSPRRFLEESS